VLFTPILKTGFQSFNLKLRKQLDLFANLVRRCRPASRMHRALAGFLILGVWWVGAGRCA